MSRNDTPSLLEAVKNKFYGKPACFFGISVSLPPSDALCDYTVGMAFCRTDTAIIVFWSRDSAEMFVNAFDSRKWSGWKKFSGQAINL